MTRAMRRAVALVVAFGLVVPAGARLDPGGRGRYDVGSTTLAVVDSTRGRTLVTEVWYPAETGNRDAHLRRGRFPLVLVAHGFCGSRTNYEFLTTSLAAHGFVVAAPDLPGVTHDECGRDLGPGHAPDAENDLRFLRVAFHDSSGAAAGFRRAIRGERAGLVGHSLGTLAVLHATIDDPMLTPAAVLAPLGGAFTAADLARLEGRPVLVAGGSADTLVALAGVTRFFGLLPAPAVLLEIAGGTHDGFTDADSSLSAAALARQQALVRRYAVAFFLRYLARARRFGRVLGPADAAAEGGDVTVVVHR
jgi:predicted dienelactone hydrolase